MTKGMKWLIAALALSLAVNIFVVGVTIGKKVSDHPGGGGIRGPRGGGPSFNLRNMVRVLPPEAQEQVKDMMREERRKLRGNYEARRAANREIIEIITAEDVDVEALSRAIDKVTDNTTALAAPIHRVMLEIVPTLSVEERREFAEKLQERRKRFRGDWGPDGRLDHGSDRGPDGRRRPPPPRD